MMADTTDADVEDSQGHASHLAELLRQADDDVLREIGEDPADHRGDDDE